MFDELKDQILVHLKGVGGSYLTKKMASRPRVNFDTSLHRDLLVDSGTRTASFESDGTL